MSSYSRQNKLKNQDSMAEIKSISGDETNTGKYLSYNFNCIKVD